MADVPTATVDAEVALRGDVRVAVVDGPDVGATRRIGTTQVIVGKSADCDLVLADEGVSRRHLSLQRDGDEVVAEDLGSKNGTFYRGARLVQVRLGTRAELRVGRSVLRIEPDVPIDDAPVPGFEQIVTRNPGLRLVIDAAARAAHGDVTVLVTGETGTGKELFARAIHRRSLRRSGPFEPLDLSSLPRDLIESELFGHARGAFTGAVADHVGAFERASGGTLFLDELGELPLEGQKRLLRVLEQREIRPVGATETRAVDVRVVAATHRDLEADVRAGTFRHDLFYRCAVVTLRIPPLRERRDDIPLLVDHLLGSIARARGEPPPDVDAPTLAYLTAQDWPGNVRQLRNVLERAVALGGDRPWIELLDARPADAATSETAPFHAAKTELIAAWERGYLRALLDRHGGNLTAAARAAGLARSHLYRLLERHAMVERAGRD